MPCIPENLKLIGLKKGGGEFKINDFTKKLICGKFSCLWIPYNRAFFQHIFMKFIRSSYMLYFNFGCVESLGCIIYTFIQIFIQIVFANFLAWCQNNMAALKAREKNCASRVPEQPIKTQILQTDDGRTPRSRGSIEIALRLPTGVRYIGVCFLVWNLTYLWYDCPNKWSPA